MFGHAPGPMEMGIILLIVLMIFGAGKLPEVGSALGKGIKEFKKATTDEPAREWRGALWSPERVSPGALAGEPESQDQALAYARDLSTLYRAERQRAARFRLLVEMGKDLTGVRSLDRLLELALQRATAFRGH